MLSQFDEVPAFRDHLPDGLRRVKGVTLLVHIGELDGLPYSDGAGIGLHTSRDHLEKRGLARAVGADDADDAACGQSEGHAVEEKPVAVDLAHPLSLDDDLAQAWSGRDVDFELFLLFLRVLAQKRFVRVHARLGLRLAPLWRHADPLQLALQGLLPLCFALLLVLEPELFLLEPGGVVTLPGDAVAPVELQDPPGHVVKEVAVVGDRDHRAFILLEMTLQPGDRLGVQMIRGLVQEQNVGLSEQKPAQGHPPLLAAGKHAHCGVARRAAQGVHGHLEPGVDVPGIQMVDLFLQLSLARHERLHLVVRHGLGKLRADLVVLVDQVHSLLQAFLHHLPYGLVRVQCRLLLEIPECVSRRQDGPAVVLLVHPGHDAQQGALAGPVQA